MRKLAVVAIVLLASISGVTAAGSKKDWATCASLEDAEAAISACTRILDFGKETKANRAIAIYNRGTAKYRKDDFAGAIEDLTQALKFDENYANAYYNRALAYSRSGSQDAAIGDYDAYERLQPGNADTSYDRALAFFRKNDIDGAIAGYDEALRRNADYANALYNRGLIYRDRAQYDAAIADFDHYLRLKPEEADAYNARGYSHRLKFSYDAALSDYNEALKRNAASALTLYNRADIFNIRGQYDAMLADSSEAVRIEPNVGEYRYFRGLAYLLKQDYRSAIADSNESIRLSPQLKEPYRVRGLAYAHLGDRNQAIADLDTAVNLAPQDPWTLSERGDMFTALGDFQAALVAYDEALKFHATLIVAHTGRCNALYQQDRFIEALVNCTKAVESDPSISLSQANLGWTYLRVGQAQLAVTPFDEAVRLNPKNAEALVGRGIMRMQQNDFAAALADAEAAISTDPQLVTAVSLRGEVREKLGLNDDALADFRRSFSLTPRAGDRDDREAQRRAQQGIERLGGGIVASTNSGATTNAAASGGGAVTLLDPGSTTTTPVELGRRVALVIGNSAYEAVSALPNPRNDAAAVASAFRRLGFSEVIERTDLRRDDLARELKAFGDLAEGSDWAVIYYAGHGIEIDGTNYLIPIDAALARASHVEDEAIPLDRVMSKVDGARKLKLVLLDACRDNPFARAMVKDSKTRSIGRGLARMEPTAGVLTVFAARDGQVSLDGVDSANSPFAEALLANLEQPRLEIGQLFRKVRAQVMDKTRSQQEPFTYGSLPDEEFFFKP